MVRLFKPARSKEVHRGIFSYLTESLINVINFIELNNIRDIKYYHDISDIQGYGQGNLFDVCFQQDENDFFENKTLYKNIETFQNILNLDCYNTTGFDEKVRTRGKEIVESFFIPNQFLKEVVDLRLPQINLTNTIGIHRRATDIKGHHDIVPLEKIFSEVENNEFDNIFLMCDNIFDLEKFRNRYGNKLITYDEFTSNNIDLPFFRYENTAESIKKHIRELIFGVIVLSKVKNLLCTKSNISSFCILSNPVLKYKLLS